jgi:leader peptidase (prepilin peptidase)/N-methyltransferase
MLIALTILWMVIGLVIGGLACRLASALSESNGMSALLRRCPSCDVPVGALPVGPAVTRPVETCPSCGARLREPWPLGETVGAVAFGLLALRFGLGTPLLLYSSFAALLILISLIDLRERLILDVLTLPAMAIALVVSFFTIGPRVSLVGGLVAGGLMLFFYLLAVLIYRRGDALGLGDVKLCLLIGLVVGGGAALSAVLYGVLAGGAIAVVVLAVKRDLRMTVPYGPSLAIGALLAILFDPAVWRI